MLTPGSGAGLLEFKTLPPIAKGQLDWVNLKNCKHFQRLEDPKPPYTNLLARFYIKAHQIKSSLYLFQISSEEIGAVC